MPSDPRGSSPHPDVFSRGSCTSWGGYTTPTRYQTSPIEQRHRWVDMSSSSVGTNRRRRTKTTRTLLRTVRSGPEWEEGRRVDAAGSRRVRPTSQGGGGGEEEGYIFLFGGLGSIRRGLRVLPHHRHKVLAFRRAPPRGAARCGWGVVVVVVVGGNEDDRRRRSRVLCRGRGRLALARVVVTLDLHPTASPFARPGESSKCKIICSCLTNCKKLVKLSFTDSCISCG